MNYMSTYIICQWIFAKKYLLMYISLQKKLSPIGRVNSMQTGKVIGERVRQKRKALGMTQEQLEAASGVPQGSISRIESGTAEDVYASTVIGFAKAFQVSADYLLGLDTSAPAQRNGSSKHPKQAKTRAKVKTPAVAEEGV
jgi:transcriptional regulator with XRE-family HTH domain